MLSFVFLLATGCGTQPEPEESRTVPYDNGIYSNQFQPQADWQGVLNPGLSEQMTAEVVGIAGVDQAEIIVYGTDVAAGLKLKPNVDKARIKKQAYETLSKTYPGYDFHITTNPSLTQDIRTLSARMQRDRPMSNLTYNIGKIIREIDRMAVFPQES